MAKVTITLTDEDDYRVLVDADFDPPLAPDSIVGRTTPAQEMGTMLLEAARDVFTKWTDGT